MFPEDYNRYAPPPAENYQPQQTGPSLSFRHGAIYPFQCLSDGWQLLKDQYLLYAAMFLLIILLTTCIGFTGLFWGAWMVSIYAALLGRMRGEPTTFGALSKGWQHFGAGFLIAFLSGAYNIVVFIALKLYELRMDQIDRAYPGDTPFPPEIFAEILAVFGGIALFYILCFIVTGVIFAFAYPLVAEHKLTGWQATKTSARAAGANFGGVFGLVLLDLILQGIGLMLCCVGLALTMPIAKATWAAAYRQVFAPPPSSAAAAPLPYGSAPGNYKGPLGL